MLMRSLSVSLLISLSIIVLQYPLREMMLWFIHPTDDVRALAVTYFNIVVWGVSCCLGTLFPQWLVYRDAELPGADAYLHHAEHR